MGVSVVRTSMHSKATPPCTRRRSCHRDRRPCSLVLITRQGSSLRWHPKSSEREKSTAPRKRGKRGNGEARKDSWRRLSACFTILLAALPAGTASGSLLAQRSQRSEGVSLRGEEPVSGHSAQRLQLTYLNLAGNNLSHLGASSEDGGLVLGEGQEFGGRLWNLRQDPRRRLLSEAEESDPERRSVGSMWSLRLRKRVRRRDPAKCWSKLERPLYHTAVRAPASAAFKAKLVDFFILQDKCTAGIRDWTKFYMGHHDPLPEEQDLAKSGVLSLSPSTCKYLVWMPPLYAGLGNRILSFVSTFLYAVLTDRALLVGPSEVLAQIICNPFGEYGTRWLITSSGFRTMYQNIKDWQPKPVDFAARIRNGTVWDRRSSYADLRYLASYEEWKFFCDSIQAGLRQAKFVGLHTDEYTVPGFYLVGAFRRLLDNWFPDRRPFLHTARFLVHPSNYIWERITRSFHAYLARAPRRVGVQVRTFYKQDAPASIRVLECAVNVSQVLPRTFASREAWEAALLEDGESASRLLRSPLAPGAAVIVASLGGRHFRHLQNFYSHRETRDGTSVTVHSEGHEGEELVGDQGQYERAMQEMWLLSFSDEVLVSDASSFGYVAAGLSGLRPHSMNICFRPKIGLDWYTNKRPICALAATSEPCYLAPPKSIQCPGKFKWSSPLDEAFGLQQCSNINMGLELMPSADET